MAKFSREHLGQKGACFPGHMDNGRDRQRKYFLHNRGERLSFEWWRDQGGSGEDASQGWVSWEAWEGGFVGRASR